MTGETIEARIKRMTMRSWRRGMKEMDLILGPFSEAALADMAEAELQLYDQMLSENDQELYRWITGQAAAPDNFAPLIQRVVQHAGAA